MITDEQRQAIRQEARYVVQGEQQQLISESVKQTLIQLGLNVDDPIELQRDFYHLRQWRTSTEALKRKGVLSAMALVVSGGISLMILGVKQWFTH